LQQGKKDQQKAKEFISEKQLVSSEEFSKLERQVDALKVQLAEQQLMLMQIKDAISPNFVQSVRFGLCL
jgi:hypothetical protein